MIKFFVVNAGCIRRQKSVGSKYVGVVWRSVVYCLTADEMNMKWRWKSLVYWGWFRWLGLSFSWKISDFLAFCHTNIATGADTRMANTCSLVKESMWGDLAKPAAFWWGLGHGSGILARDLGFGVLMRCDCLFYLSMGYVGYVARWLKVYPSPYITVGRRSPGVSESGDGCEGERGAYNIYLFVEANRYELFWQWTEWAKEKADLQELQDRCCLKAVNEKSCCKWELVHSLFWKINVIIQSISYNYTNYI